MKIHVWVPDYASAIGGIQTLSRFLVRALREIMPEARICVFSKNDTSFPEPAFDWTTSFTPLGWWPPGLRTSAFSIELFRCAAFDRPDLVITTHPNFSPVANWLKKAFGIPYVAIGNGIDVWEVRSRHVRAALRNANKLLAISEYTRQRMAVAIGIAPDNILLFPCTVDSDQFVSGPKPRFLLKRYRLRANQPVILTITRLASAERYKGYDQLLSAIPAVRQQFPDVRYVLGGRGPDRPRVEALVRKLGVEENVILAGYIPEHELREHYNLCDVFAMPSKGEGFGIVFLEAMVCGKAVLAGNKDGSVDPLLDGTIGVLIDPDDVAQIADALIAILARKTNGGEFEKLKTGVTDAKQRPGFPKLKCSMQIPDIIFDPAALRRKAIDAYGYDRFKQRLEEVLRPLLNGKGETRNAKIRGWAT